MNKPSSIIEHFATKHAVEAGAQILIARWKRYLENNFVSKDKEYGIVSAEALAPPDLTECTIIFRDIPENMHYLTYWLNLFLASGVLQTTSLQYQELDSLMQEHLQQPSPLHNWKACFVHAGVKGYNFFIGEGILAVGYTQLDQSHWKSIALKGHTFAHFRGIDPTLCLKVDPVLTVFLLNRLVACLDSSVVIQGNNVKRYLVTVCYDGQPLNQGTFINQNGSHVVMDGNIPPLTFAGFPSSLDETPNYCVVR